MVRYDTDGSLDETFGTSGKITIFAEEVRADPATGDTVLTMTR
jgi:hypothetical protein